MRQLLKTTILLVGLLAWASGAFAAAYSTTGSGTSTIGSGGDYPSLAEACAALSGTTNNFTVTNKAKTSNVVTLTLSGTSTFAVGNSITVSIGDTAFDGTKTVSATSGSTVSYTLNGADVASTAASGKVWTTAGTGTRDASAWTFEILNDLTETLNSEIRCTVDSSGSVTFRPASGVRATITWPTTISANSQSSGHISIGTTNGGTTIGFTATQNIIFDGSNTVGGTSRDLVITNAIGDPEGSIGIIRVRGNNDNLTFKNLIVSDPNTGATSQAFTFTSHAGSGGNDCPDNWTVDNCLIVCNNVAAGSGITASNSGTITSGTAQSGWAITNNTIQAGSRPIFLNQNAGGTISGNTIRSNGSTGLLGACIYHLTSNSASGFTMNITRNIIDNIQTPNASAGDFGQHGIIITPPAQSCTINVKENMIGGWAFTGAAADSVYIGIRIDGGASNSANVNIENNSINMHSTASVTGATLGRACAIRRTASGTTPTTTIKNNIIRFLQAGTNAYAIYAAASGTLTISGNNVVIGGSSAGFANIGGTATTVFSNGSTGFVDAVDTTAQNVDPTTTSGGTWASFTPNHPADLHFTGTPSGISAVTSTAGTDIDGDTRSTSEIPGADVVSGSQTTYVWTASGTANFGTATNWTPNRTSPRWNDILSFSNGGSVVVNDLRDNHIGGLTVSGSTTVSMNALGGIAGSGVGSGTRLTILNTQSGDDFSIASGSSLTIGGKGGIMLVLPGGATGTISGDLVLANSATNAVTRVQSHTAGGLVIASGGTVAMATGNSGAGSPFGASATTDGAGGSTTGTPGVVFQSGAAYYSGGTKDFTASANAPSNPFALTAPSSMCEFLSGSTYYSVNGTPAASGRTFGYGGNVVARSASSTTVSGTGGWVVGGTVSNEGAGAFNISFTGGTGVTYSFGGLSVASSGVGNLDMAAFVPGTANTLTITGNVDVGNGTQFNPPTSTNLTISSTGASPTINFGGDTIPNLTFNNSTGATLTGNVTVSGTLTLTAGTVATGSNTLTLSSTADPTRTSGSVSGNFNRAISAATGARVFHMSAGGQYSPVTVNFTSAPTAGTLAAKATATAHPSAINPSVGISRYWTLTESGLGSYTADLTFQYDDVDLGSVIEANLQAHKWNGSSWTGMGGTVSTGANTVTVTGVSGFSDWALGEAALPVELDSFVVQ